MSAKTKIVVPLNLPPDLEKKIEETSIGLQKSKAETMRIAMEVGLARLKLHHYDLYGPLAADPPNLLKVAEEPGKTSSPSIRAPGVRGIKYPQARTRKSGTN